MKSFLLGKRTQGIIKQQEANITSLTLVEQINFFRRAEGNTKELRHDNMMGKIKKYNEAMEQIGALNIKGGSYKDKQNQKRPMFLLTKTQAMLFMAGESFVAQHLLGQYIDQLETENTIMRLSIQHAKATNSSIGELKAELGLSHKVYANANRAINDLVAIHTNEEYKVKEDMTVEQLEVRAQVEEMFVERAREIGGIKGVKAYVRDGLHELV